MYINGTVTMSNVNTDDFMQIIDIETKGNVVRFYIGKNGEQWGDDWDDTPYEHNAGCVYKKYIRTTSDVTFPFDKFLFEPKDIYSNNSQYSKEDMIKRKIPCLIVSDTEHSDFISALGDKDTKKYYFGDIIN